MNIICCSGGNDSIALIQWVHENELSNVTVVYNNTGWPIFWSDLKPLGMDKCPNVQQMHGIY